MRFSLFKSMCLATAGALLVAVSMGSGPATSVRAFTSNYENVLGTSLELKVWAANQADATRAETAVLGEIARQSTILSSWDTASEFSRFAASHGTPVRVSQDLYDVLDLFDRWKARTNGALDPAAQAVIKAWTSAASADRLPTRDELAAAVRTVRQQHWSLNPTDRSATHLSDAPLVLASLTKSYIIDHAVKAAIETGAVRGVVLNIGGDIVVRGPVSERIDIADPKADAENDRPISQIVVADRAVATSGDYRRGVTIKGVHYSHIVDPRSGMPAGEVVSSTVVAGNPADAGALATAFSILTPAESQTLAASIPGVEYLLVTKAGQQIASRGWRALEAATEQTATAPARQVPAPAQARPGTWNTSMELAVNFEIPVLGGAAKRPFIGIWIEDTDRFPVRTLALWYHEDRWLTEMKAWYRADRLRSMSETTSIVRSVGAATRPPGKYTMKWDGKDNAGQLVKAGTYHVYLESSREHGTYQLIHQEMNFNGTPQQFQFGAGSEIAAASFVYQPVGK